MIFHCITKSAGGPYAPDRYSYAAVPRRYSDGAFLTQAHVIDTRATSAAARQAANFLDERAIGGYAARKRAQERRNLVCVTETEIDAQNDKDI